MEACKRKELRETSVCNRAWFVPLLVFLLFPMHSLASERPGDDFDPRDVQPSSRCPLLFGDEQTRESNHLHRIKTLQSVRIYENSVLIVHHTNWHEPGPAEMAGIEIVEIDMSDESDPVALVSLTGDWDAFECEPGVYAVHLDDSIGPSAQVIAILPDTLLFEYEDTLYFMAGDDAENHDWRMAWASPWKLVILPDSRSSGARSNRANTGHTRRSKHSKRRR